MRDIILGGVMVALIVDMLVSQEHSLMFGIARLLVILIMKLG